MEVWRCFHVPLVEVVQETLVEIPVLNYSSVCVCVCAHSTYMYNKTLWRHLVDI